VTAVAFKQFVKKKKNRKNPHENSHEGHVITEINRPIFPVYCYGNIRRINEITRYDYIGEQRLSTTRELHKRYRVPISSCHNIRHTTRITPVCYLFNSIETDNLSTKRYTYINVYTYTCTERLYKINIFFHQFVGRCFVSFIRCWIKDNISACVYFSRLAITFIASDVQAAHERSAAYACNSARGISCSKKMKLSRNKKYNRFFRTQKCQISHS